MAEILYVRFFGFRKLLRYSSLRCESIYIGDLFPNSMTQILTDPYVCPVTSISRGRIAKSSALVFYLVALGSLGEP